MTDFKKLTKEELMESITEGVKQAILQMTETENMIIRESFLEAIRQGTQDALYCCGLENHIKKAVSDSFPYGSEILSCIYQGTKDGIKPD
jgi:hypothetical protein